MLTTQENDVVLDPFIGTGTTAAVAKRMGRHYIGFEINPDYCDIARKRVEQTPVQPSLLEFFV
jgi:site-specific DNA-methyltransferase (adenine-specific)